MNETNIKLSTNYPLAIDSDDHKYPEGIWYDNNLNLDFANEIENYFNNKPINFLDLGCAGGQLVVHMHEKGHTAVGLEGSNHCLVIDQDIVNRIGMEPRGKTNWEKYHNKVLFTCDVTKEYSITRNSELLQFDLISCFDVIEHFYPDQLDMFFKLVCKHLKPDGLFIASIALFDSGCNSLNLGAPQNLNYHKSVFTESWWLEKTKNYFNKTDYPFLHHNRPKPGVLLFSGKKII